MNRDHTTPQRELEIGEEYVGECVAWFHRGLGYGFIRVPGARNIFVSALELQHSPVLDPGERVRFFVRMDHLGRLQATHCTPLDGDLLQAMPKATGGEHGGRKKLDGSRVEPSDTTPTYADLGLDKKTPSLPFPPRLDGMLPGSSRLSTATKPRRVETVIRGGKHVVVPREF